MTQEEIRNELMRKPFAPFRLHLRDGRRLDVPFSHVILFQKGSFMLFKGVEAEGVQVAKSYEHVQYEAVDHISPMRPPRGRKKAS
jgi:hypothetical protein